MRIYNLAVAPGSSKNNKTGSWRTFRPVVDHKKCIACGRCEDVCPEGVCFAVGNTPLTPLDRGEMGNTPLTSRHPTGLSPLDRGELGKTPQSTAGDCGGEKKSLGGDCGGEKVCLAASESPLGDSDETNGGQAPEGEQKVYYENDLDYCKGCGICARECPVKAIRMEREEK